VHPACGGTPEALCQCRPRRQNGCREEHEADEGSDEGFPVLVPGPQKRGDQKGPTHDHPDDPISAARRPFRDRPPPTADTECESSRPDGQVHAVANQEADQGGSEQQDHD